MVKVGKRSVAQNLAVDVGIAVAMTGQSHTSLITVTAAMERVALCAVAEVIAVLGQQQHSYHIYPHHHLHPYLH